MRILTNIWYWIVGYPAELTYWFEGNETTLQVRKFKEIKPKTLSWKECPMTNGRTTYEVVKSDEES